MTHRIDRASRLGRLLLVVLPLCVAAPRAATAEEAPPLFKYSPQTLTDAGRKGVATLYARTCAGCHGMDGGGVNNGLALYNAKEAMYNASVIHFGAVEPVDKPVIMPAYGALNILNPTEIGQLATYITSFHPPWPAK